MNYFRKVKLPASEPSLYGDEDKDRDQAPTRTSTRMTSYTVDVPKAAVAGLIGEKAEELEEIQDVTPRVTPLCQAWTPAGDLFVGCRGGQLIRVSSDFCFVYTREGGGMLVSVNKHHRKLNVHHHTFLFCICFLFKL